MVYAVFGAIVLVYTLGILFWDAYICCKEKAEMDNHWKDYLKRKNGR